MITPGARVRQERLRQRLTMKELAARAKISEKSLQRIERDERDELLPLVEDILGLPPSSDPQPPAMDEAEMLRRVPHRRFWLEAARRAQEIADQVVAQHGRIMEIPAEQLPPPRAAPEHDESDTTGSGGGW